MKPVSLFILFFLLYNVSSAQSKPKYVYYFDKDLKTISKKDTLYTGIGSVEDSLVAVKIYGNYNGNNL